MKNFALIFLVFFFNSSSIAKEVSFVCSCYENTTILRNPDNPLHDYTKNTDAICFSGNEKSIHIDIENKSKNGESFDKNKNKNHDFKLTDKYIEWIYEDDKINWTYNFDRYTGVLIERKTFEPLIKYGEPLLWKENIIEIFKCKKAERLL